MASIRKRGQFWHLSVRAGGRQLDRGLGTADEREARRLKGCVERTLADLKLGRLAPPVGVDLLDFLLSDGRLQAPAAAESPPPATLGHLWAA